jgi:hypothetical protein
MIIINPHHQRVIGTITRARIDIDIIAARRRSRVLVYVYWFHARALISTSSPRDVDHEYWCTYTGFTARTR